MKPASEIECIACLYAVVKDMLPQIGGIVLQDYERLNRGMMLAERILAVGDNREKILGNAEKRFSG